MRTGTPPIEPATRTASRAQRRRSDRSLRSSRRPSALASFAEVSVDPILAAGSLLGQVRLQPVSSDSAQPTRVPFAVHADVVAEYAWRTPGDASDMARRASERGMQVLVVESDEVFHLVLSDRRLTAREARQLAGDPDACGRVVAIADDGVVTSVPWGRSTWAPSSPSATPIAVLRPAQSGYNPTASSTTPFGA